MAVFPVNSNFEGDFLLQLVPVDTDDTMDQVAEKCARHSVGRRVKPQADKVMRVRLHQTNECFPRDMKVSETSWRPTETLDIIFADQ